MTAARFHDGRSGADRAVTAFVFGRDLRIADADGATIATWRLDQIVFAPEPDPDGMIMVRVRNQPGQLLLNDPATLDAMRRSGVGPRQPRPWRAGHWITAAVAAVCVLGLCGLLLDSAPALIARAIPPSWEQRLGAPGEALIGGSAHRCAGADGQAALTRLVERLRAAGPIAMPVRIEVLDNPLINAFTLPGGHVVVMRGLIDAAPDGPVLSGVIAHELGHVAHHDTTTLLLRRLGLSALLSLIGFGDGGGAVVQGAGDLLTLAHGRAAEAAADATAIDLLTAAGLRADGLSRFFAQMDAHPGPDHAASLPSWLANHPPSDERRAKTERPATGEMPFTDAEWRAIRTMCGAGQSSL
jgi:Zn-dependent protease with chaperone function